MSAREITLEELLTEQMRLAKRDAPDMGGMTSNELAKAKGISTKLALRHLKEAVEAGTVFCRFCPTFDIAGRRTAVPKYFVVKKPKK